MSKDYKLLIEPFSLTAYFRSITNIPYSFDIINFLIKLSHLSMGELERRWDNFSFDLGTEYGNKISALSFATIIEARGMLLNNLINSKDTNNITIELASGLTPRGLNIVNNGNSTFIETDRENVIKLKKEFYEYLHSINKKTPEIHVLDVLNFQHFREIYDLVKIEKYKNNTINQVTLLSEGLIIYLSKQEQRTFFENLREFSKLLKELNIKVNYLTIDMPTHENFTNWLVHEDFSLKDHLDVMSRVDPKIIESLHNTQEDFVSYHGLPTLKKHYYTAEIITSLKTPKLAKYKKIPDLKEKINKFLTQKVLFAWEIEL